MAGAAQPLSAQPLIPNDQNAYRGMSNANWVKNGAVQYKAYMLRPANDQFPAETELSVGRTAQSAIEDLHENHGVARLSVHDVHQLPHSLTVREDPESNSKAYLHGLPMFSTEQQQRGRAVTMATDLAHISVIVAPAPN